VRILSIIGTRPEAIKMAPVIRELGRAAPGVESVVCVTGQHRQMLDQVLALFGIRPEFDLDLMRPDQTLSAMTARLFEGLGRVVDEARPDWVLAQGDTTTVMAAALTAYYHRARFGHVEAGLRTGDKNAPFPEEMNRVIADAAADLFFAPTECARRALLAEGRPEADIFLTGNTVVDALLEIARREYDWSAGPLRDLPAEKNLVLITAHRRESFGRPFRQICGAIRQLARTFEGDGVHFVYPAHLNPNVRGPVGDMLTGLPTLSVLGPLDYLSMVHLMKRSRLILTDSGGLQEEAPSFGVPVLVMREKVERPEGVTAGVARLVGTDPQRIVAEATRLLRDPAAHAAMARGGNPYGDGLASQRIVSALIQRGAS